MSDQALGLATGGAWSDYVTTSATDSIRQRIVDALGLRLATILTGAGYKTNLGLNAYPWRDEPFQASELPAVEYRDTESSSDFSIGEVQHNLKIALVLFGTSPTEIRSGLADLEQCLGLDRDFGGLAEEVLISSDSMTIQQAENIYVGSSLTLDITYVTKAFDPYTQ